MNYSAELPSEFRTLRGPGPDVALMARVLMDKGIASDQIRVLTDAPELIAPLGIDADIPDRKTILAELGALAQGAGPGDAITIYIAGHGAQIPAQLKPDETDGFDEVFLPADFSFGADGAPVNMVLDDEIGTRLDQMITAGADVWLIADTCHAGSIRRSTSNGLVPRFVDLNPGTVPGPEEDGIADLTAPRTEVSGQFTGFYAASAGALAYEAAVPGTGANHGLMTWALAQALRRGQAATFSDLARSTTARMWRIGKGRADPQFEGAMGAPHLFAGAAFGSARYALSVDQGITVAAGQFDGIAPGTVFSVLDADGTSLFEFAATDVSLTQSMGPVPAGDLPQLDGKLISERLDPVRFRNRWLRDRAPVLEAEIKSRPAELSLLVSIEADELDQDMSDGIVRVISDLSPRLALGDRNPDLRIVAEAGQLILEPAPSSARHALAVPATPEHLPRLKDLLRQATKARALVGIGQTLQASSLSQQLQVDLTQSAGLEDAGGTCFRTERSESDQYDQTHAVPRVSHCDSVSITIQNNNPWPVDLTPLYIAPDNQVYFLSGYEHAEKGGWRIGAGDADSLNYVEATRRPDGTALATGRMYLVLLAERGVPGAVPVDFRYLQSPVAPPETRSVDQGSLNALLRDAGFGLAERRFVGNSVIGQSGAVVLPMKTVGQKGAGRVGE